MKKIFSLLIILIFNNYNLINSATDFQKLKHGKEDMRYANLDREDLSFRSLFSFDFWDANMRQADLRFTDLRLADLRGANLSNSKMHHTRIKGALVKKANFKWVKGLTNEQKQYLRDNGALNVPADLIYENPQLEFSILQDLTKWYRKLRSISKETQTDIKDLQPIPAE